MSLISSLWKGALGIAKAVIPGVSTVSKVVSTVGTAALGAVAGSKGAPAVVSKAIVPVSSNLPSVIPGAGLSTLGSLTLGAAAGAVGSKVVGTMMSDGTVVKKRRVRRKGISATELKNYDRVDRFLNKRFKCSTARRISKR